MRKIRTLFICLFLVITIGGCSSFGVGNIIEDIYTNMQDITLYEGNFYYDQLTDHEKAVYCAIMNAAHKFKGEVRLPFFSKEEVSRAVKACTRENPLYYWVNEHVIYTISPEDNVTNIEFKEECSEATFNQLKQICETIVEESKAESEEETLRNIYLNLAERITYVADSEFNQDIRSSLINGESVCAGYAKALQAVLQVAGYQNYYVTGIATQEDSTDPHGWNLINLDNEWYWCDLTWDDRQQTHNDYFLVSDAELLAHHTPDTELFSYPECTSEKYNSFIGKENYFEVFDQIAVEKYIASQIKNGSKNITVKFKTDEAYKEAEYYICECDGLYVLFRNYVSETAGYNCGISKEPNTRILRFIDFKIKGKLN